MTGSQAPSSSKLTVRSDLGRSPSEAGVRYLSRSEGPLQEGLAVTGQYVPYPPGRPARSAGDIGTPERF